MCFQLKSVHHQIGVCRVALAQRLIEKCLFLRIDKIATYSIVILMSHRVANHFSYVAHPFPDPGSVSRERLNKLAAVIFNVVYVSAYSDPHDDTA